MTEPIVELARVHARDASGREGRPRGSLAGMSLSLEAGAHAVLGTPEDGTLALVDVLSGARPATRGRVTVLGRDPARSPALRAHVGVLAADPRLPDARTVRDAVRVVTRARGDIDDRFDAIMDPFGLSGLARRGPRSLSFAEERAVELALALSTPAPVLLVLHEPFVDVAGARLEAIAPRVSEIAGAGACVIVTTSSPLDARALADHVLVLHRGLVAREARGGAGLGVRAEATLRAWVAAPTEAGGRGARDLCAALAMRPEIQGVALVCRDDAASRERGGADVVELRGSSAEACGSALIDAAVALDVEIEAIRELAPGLGEVHASTEALFAMARTRRVGPAAAPPPVRTTPAPVEIEAPK